MLLCRKVRVLKMRSITMTWEDLIEEVRPGFQRITALLAFDPVYGALKQKEFKAAEFLSPQGQARIAEACAEYFACTEEEEYRAFAERCLDAVQGMAVRIHGRWHWMIPFPVTCQESRIWGNMYRVARILGREDIIEWLGEVIRAWPYSWEDHWFIQQIATSTGEPIVDVHALNMEMAAVGPTWLVGEHLGDEDLKARAEDCVLNLLIPSQKEDGSWDYDCEGHFRHVEDGYTMLNMYEIAELLWSERWRKDEAYCNVFVRCMEYMKRECTMKDGAIIGDSHWGISPWGNTATAAYTYWMLVKYLDRKEYEEPAIRCVNWLLKCKPSGGYPGITIVIGGAASFESTIMLPLMRLAYERFEGTAQIPHPVEHAATLRLAAGLATPTPQYGTIDPIRRSVTTNAL